MLPAYTHAAIALVFALVLAAFLRFHRPGFLREWTAALAAMAAALALSAWGGSPPAALAAWWLHLFWTATGTLAVVGRPMTQRLRLPAVAGIATGAVVLSVLVHPPAYPAHTLPMGLVFVGAAVALWRYRPVGRRGPVMLAAAFAVHGLLALADPLGPPAELDVAALLAVGLGIVHWLLENEHAERRAALAELESSEARHRRIVEGMGVALWVEDLSELVAKLRAIPAGTAPECRTWLNAHPEFVAECVQSIKVLNVNDAALRIYEAGTHEELIARVDQLFLPESQHVFIDELVAFWEGRTSFDAEVVSQTLKGARRILFYSIRAPFPEHGFGYVLISVVDVTPLRAAEAALRESEERYRTLFHNAPVGIGVADGTGTLLAVNETMRSLGGFTRDDPLPPVYKLYYDPDVRDSLLAELRSKGVVRHREVRFCRKDGSPWEANLSLARITLDGRPCVLAIVEDIAQRKQLEDALRQAQKMEAVGQLTGGIAHDFNNFLTAIQVNAELAADLVVTDPAEAQRALSAVRRTAERSAGLVRNLLAFSRREGLRLTPTALAPVVEETAALLRRLLPESIAVTARVPEALRDARIPADRSALEQVIVNLATNARDAMPDGGTFTLRLDTTVLHEPLAVVGGRLEPGDWLTLTVTDDGTGMAPGLVDRAFEPFFTTKPQGSGSGLGLAMVYGLLRQQGGGITLETRPGQGTRFVLYFPRTSADLEVPAGSPEQATGGAGETVLVVEDELAIREATRRLLARSGYRVLTAGDGAEGLTVLTALPSDIRLVVADVVMPTMGGPQLLQATRARGLTVPFIFMSGYPDRAAEGVSATPDIPLLAKPWRADELLRLVRERLARVPT